MSSVKVLSLLTGVLALVVIMVLGDNSVSSNSSKPVIFLTSPTSPSNASSDTGKSESRVNQKIITELPLAGLGNTDKKQSVSSQGYNLEVLEDDDTSEENDGRRGQTQKGSEPQLNIYPTSGLLGSSPRSVDEYIHPEYDDNSAKEDSKGAYVPKGRIAYGDIKPTSDIGKVRDIFVSKEVTKTLTGSASEDSPSPAPQESNYKLDYESSPVVKFAHESPIVLKQSGLLEPSPLSSPLEHHPHHYDPHHHDDHHDHHHHDHHDRHVIGHEAGYGHGFHHHQQKLKSKPLKPSVVYRDPHDRFDHHDKIRTLDKDLKHEKDPHHPHRHFEPHVIGKGHEFQSYHHGKKVYHYDQSKVPECAHKNKYIYNLTFCLDDPHYPIETIVYALKDSGYYAKKLLSDVTYQSADNLVTGLTRAVEEGYTYKHYFGASHAQNIHLDKYKPPYHGYTYSTDYFKKGGYICPSDIYYARPKRAMNTFGKWKVIINVDHIPDHGYDKHGHHGHSYGHDSYQKHGHESYDKGHGSYGKEHGHEESYGKGHSNDDSYGKEHGHDSYGKSHDSYGKDYGHDDHNDHGLEHLGHDSYSHSLKKREYKEYKKSYTQTLRLEQCIYPNAPCSYVDSHYHSSCIQKHNFVRLVAWTHDEGLHVDTFKMPIACSCHVRQPIHFYHESGHHQHKHGQIVPPVTDYHGHHSHSPHHDPIEHRGIAKKIY